MNNYTTNEHKFQVSFLEMTDEEIQKGQNTFDCTPRTFACNWALLEMTFEIILTPEISRIPNADKLTGEQLQKRLKNSVPAFMNARFKPDSRKKLTNVEEITIIGLDIDNKNPDTKISYEEIEKILLFWGWRAVIYTSYSHTRSSPRFRVVLFPSEPISVDDWPGVWESLNHLFDNQIDNSTKRLNAFFYFPSKPPGSNEGHFVKILKGDLLDIKTLTPAPTADSTQEARNGDSRGLYEPFINWLSDDELQSATERFREQYRIRRLAPDTSRDDSNSALEFAMMLYCVGRRASFECVHSWFEKDGRFEHYNKNKRLYRENGAVSRLKYDYEMAQKRPDTQKFLDGVGDVRRIVPMVREHIENDCEMFKGAKGERIKQVLQTHLTKMEETGKTTYDLSVRDMAKPLHKGEPMTCWRHTKTLIKEGWLEQVRVKVRRGNAKKYTLGPNLKSIWEMYEARLPELLHTTTYKREDDSEFKTDANSHICVVVCNNSGKSNGIQSPDVCGQTETFGVFTHQSLGQLCEKIYLLLKPGPLNIEEIQQKTNRSLRTVKEKLKRMETLSIVTVAKGVVSLNPDLNLPEMGEILGTIDKNELKDARLTREQENFKFNKVEVGEFNRKEFAHKWHLVNCYHPTEAEIEFYAEQDRERERWESDYNDYQSGLFNEPGP